MALSNKFNQFSLHGGGSTPTWKRLGYSSQAEYINALTGADGKKKIPTTLEEAYGSNSAIQLSPQDRLGNFDQDVVAKVWNGGGSGGVTDEGVVIGNPNVEKFPTIKNSSSGQKSSDTLAGMKDTNVVASGGGSVPAGSDGTSAGTGGAATATGSNEFGAKYHSNDFLEWYKANYGTDYDPSQGFSRGQGMSDVDWAIGSNLYNSYLTGQNLENSYNSSKNELEQNYGQSVEALDKSKRNSQQAASITLDKLKKYLPTQIKAQGLGGLGVSESSMLQAYNDYNNRMGAIESDYNANKSTLDANRESTLSELERAYLDNKTNLGISAGEQSQNIFDKYLADYKAEQSELYNQALYALQNSNYTSEEDMLAFIDQISGGLNTEKVNLLKQNVSGLVAQNVRAEQEKAEAKAEAEREAARTEALSAVDLYEEEEDYEGALAYLERIKGLLSEDVYESRYQRISNKLQQQNAQKEKDEAAAQAETDRRVITGQELVEYNGKHYQIQSRLDKNANEIAHNDDFKEQIKAMGFSGAYDKKIPNGTTLVVKSDAYGKNEFNLIDDWLGGANITDWRNWIPGYNLYNYANRWFNFETRTLTYYNGEWYSSIEAAIGG